MSDRALPPVAGGPAERVWLGYLRREPLTGAPLTTEEWVGLAQLAKEHQLSGLTYRLMADSADPGRVPADILERLRSVYLDTAMRNAVLFRHTSQLAAALGDLGIPVMLLKGVHLARFVYPEPGLRTMADLDLMVPRSRLAEAERVLLDLGFGPLPRPDLEAFCAWSNHLAKLIKPGAPVVELHWGIERPTSPFRIDLDGLWDRSVEATVERVPVRLLCPEDLLLHLALHCSYHHEFDRHPLKGLVDLDAVVSRHRTAIAWTTLAERANQWGASGFVYTAFRVAGAILGTQVPASVFEALGHRETDEDVVATAIRHTLAPHVDVPGPYVELAESKRLSERARILGHSLFPPRATMERIYRLRRGTWLLPWYYVARFFSLVGRRSRLFLSALIGSRTVQPALDQARDRVRLKNWAAGGQQPEGAALNPRLPDDHELSSS